MHIFVISLFTILAGTLLLAKFRKDMPGKFFAFISWFFIVVGFVLFVGFIGGAVVNIAHHGFKCNQECKEEMMMEKGGPGMHGCVCCPENMDKGMCSRNQECREHGDMMKCCPKHMEGDSTKTPVPKK